MGMRISNFDYSRSSHARMRSLMKSATSLETHVGVSVSVSMNVSLSEGAHFWIAHQCGNEYSLSAELATDRAFWICS